MEPGAAGSATALVPRTEGNVARKLNASSNIFPARQGTPPEHQPSVEPPKRSASTCANGTPWAHERAMSASF